MVIFALLLFYSIFTVFRVFIAFVLILSFYMLIYTVIFTVFCVFITFTLILLTFTISSTVFVVYIVIYTDILDFYCCFMVIFTMGSSSSDRISIQKLKGASNYKVWALRTEAFLIKEGLKEAISSNLFDLEEDINDKALANIKLLVEDGPLLQIQHISTTLEA